MYDVEEPKYSPAQHSLRIRIDDADWETVSAAVAKLRGAGAPEFAHLVFQPWPSHPDSRCWIAAVWWEQRDGTLTKAEHPEEAPVGS